MTNNRKETDRFRDYLSTETGFKFAREKLDKLIKTGTSVYVKDAKELRKNLAN